MKSFYDFYEELMANNPSSGNIAGLPPDDPPVNKKKKYIYGGRGSRKMWMSKKYPGSKNT